MAFTQYSQIVKPAEYLPEIPFDIYSQGVQKVAATNEQKHQNLQGQYNNLFAIKTYGKDAEVLGQMQQEFQQQVGELSKQGLSSPEAQSKINQLISSYSTNPDVMNIHKRKAKFDEWNSQLQDYQEKGKFVPAWKMKQYNDAQNYYSGSDYYTNKQFTGNLTPGFDWDKHNKELIASTPEIEQLKKSGVNNNLYKGKTYNALQGKFYEGLQQPGALDDLREHFEYDYGNEDYASHDQQLAIQQVNKLNNIIATSSDPILVNQAKSDLDYWSDFSGSVNPQTSKEEAFQRYIKANSEDFARTNTNYALKESKMSDASKMYQEHEYRQQEKLYEHQLDQQYSKEANETLSLVQGLEDFKKHKTGIPGLLNTDIFQKEVPDVKEAQTFEYDAEGNKIPKSTTVTESKRVIKPKAVGYRKVDDTFTIRYDDGSVDQLTTQQIIDKVATAKPALAKNLKQSEINVVESKLEDVDKWTTDNSYKVGNNTYFYNTETKEWQKK
jgi:hypothetical protein